MILSRRSMRGFTLAELLVVIAIIAILGTITVVAVARLTSNARLSSGTNAVVAGLETARSIAIRENRPVGLFFVPKWDPLRPEIPQRTELVICIVERDPDFETVGSSENYPITIDRYRPVPDVPRRQLPAGIKVAGPHYSYGSGTNDADPGDVYGDFFWITQPELRFTDSQSPEVEAGAVREFAGQMLGVLFDGDGSMITSSSLSNARFMFFDRFPGNQEDPKGSSISRRSPQDVYSDQGTAIITGLPFEDTGTQWDWQDDHRDETNIQIVPFLAVYDDEAARELKVGPWNTAERYRVGVSDYIAENGRRIHFNRYSGVVMQ